MDKNKIPVIVVGGGLAGLISSICLQKAGVNTLLIEKKSYPFHRVCGEYISNEVKPFLERMDLFPEHIKTSKLSRFKLSDIKGNLAEVELPLGGFGVSRYRLDEFLYQKALNAGVEVKTKTEVNDIRFNENEFTVSLKTGESLTSEFVINAYGKRSKLDKVFDRDFIKRKSPFLGVKYHAKVDFPKDVIGLYNFKGGYCGVSHVEDDKVNICYLSRRENLKGYGGIAEMEKAILYQNPILEKILENAEMLFEKPEVINEISFEKKDSVENHMLMAGDTAGLITPLCGNGMAMAIHSGYLASTSIINFYQGQLRNRHEVESEYSTVWKKNFSKRLWVGRKTQNLFGNQMRAGLSVGFVRNFPSLAKKLIQQTHGDVF
ncbi:FAD-dependent oxidoreductase [Marivirga tractuosa]|uniref:Monooxygenase FAD-binding protein n=1 Tax=Marivirga tractuosa (strain ATCC 23168 / DSM 4126 / NBRC 15989 / NCIMB 1408 / VKM B-1430 / H-43) TaxID=643867 RepID=E4TN27_MARTH|nr:NAD(P)/FAD-dependent oxidoreductase [Marivirga tractuosa]ADR22441.1 monooxygenase FAD-binding protein [Marivirga tractuosa DSM 4126]BDD16888.1 FAD-dependent oxidoreductase [Marivirga tractuosa]